MLLTGLVEDVLASKVVMLVLALAELRAALAVVLPVEVDEVVDVEVLMDDESVVDTVIDVVAVVEYV